MNPKIILIEDDETNRERLAALLENHGFQVVQARDGHEGIAAAQSERPDLILMDLGLPGLNGWEATRRIKDSANMSDIPILVLTGQSMPEDEISAYEAGCDAFHAKPIDWSRLIEEIGALIGRT